MTIPSWFFDLPNIVQEKLRRDIFYFSMVKNGCSYVELLNSGWLTTSYGIGEDEFNKKKFTTSLPYSSHVSEKDELCVLVNTGSYAPAHDGHIEMLLEAKKEIECNGFIIDAMIFSPSHDSYVLLKSENIKSWNISNRLVSLEEKINSYDCLLKEKELLSIDLWESLYCNCPINFTDVIMKIKHNINVYLGKKVKIFYVFGSDNHNFMDCFYHLPEEPQNDFFGVCVERTGFEIKDKKIRKNCFYTNNKKYGDCKSRLIREDNLLVENNFKFNKNELIYGVRYEPDFALKLLIDKYPENENLLRSSYFQFHEGLKKNIFKATGIDVVTVDVKKQIQFLKNINTNLINLDSCTNYLYGENKIEFSRLFLLNSLQNKPTKMVSRDNCEIDIKEGDYTLVDDDIASGATMFLVKDILSRKGINVINELSLLKTFIDKYYNGKKIYDVVDTRDFLLCANQGGLVCALGNNNVRFPYLSPWINLNTRAKIDIDKIKIFNLDNLLILKCFFEKNYYLNLSDLSPVFADFMNKNYFEKTLVSCIDRHFEWVLKNMI